MEKTNCFFAVEAPDLRSFVSKFNDLINDLNEMGACSISYRFLSNLSSYVGFVLVDWPDDKA